MEVCMAWEKAAKQARSRNLTAAQARKVLAEMVTHSTGEALTSYTLSNWLDEWLANKGGGASDATMSRYRQVCRDFKARLGDRATAPLGSITSGDIISFRDSLRKEGRAISTCNNVVKKILSVPFASAWRLGHIPVNPVAGVDPLKEGRKGSTSIREPFTASEVKSLVSKANGDWKGVIILASTTGLRLGDAVGLKWADIDQDAGFIHVETQKTGEKVELPIHSDFSKWLKGETQGVGKAPVFPTLSKSKINGKTGLSSQFRNLMGKADIKEKAISSTGDAGRTRFSKGFHGLRHTFVSRLAAAGVTPEVRQKLTAHSDDMVHQKYTHHERATFREAVDKLTSVL